MRITGNDPDDLLEQSVPKSLRVLIDILENRDGQSTKSQQIKAAELLLDRSLGKAPQHVSLTHDTEDLLERIRQGRLEDLMNGVHAAGR